VPNWYVMSAYTGNSIKFYTFIYSILNRFSNTGLLTKFGLCETSNESQITKIIK